MRVCLVGPTYPFRGGIAHYNTVLFQELSKSYETFMVSLRKQYPKLLFPGKTQADESQDAIQVENTPLLTPLNPLTWRRAARHIAQKQPDLVVIQWWHPFFAPAFGSLAASLRRRGIRVCFLCHNGKAHEKSAIDGLLTRYALNRADALIAHSEGDAAALREARPDAEITVSPHPSYDCFRRDDVQTSAQAREKLALPQRDTLLFFGYIRRYKGLPTLLEAMPRIVEQRDCQLVIVGEFYHDEQLIKDTISDLGLGDRIHLVDRYVANEEVHGFFEAADAVVLPYRSASQSGIVQIAYSFDRPVVATRVGGLPEIIEDGVTGTLCEPDDPAGLADAVSRFFDTERAVFEQGIEQHRHRFSWDRMVEVIEKVAGRPEALSQRERPSAARTREQALSTTSASRTETSSASKHS